MVGSFFAGAEKKSVMPSPSIPEHSIPQLLDENLLSVSSYLSLQEVRALASTCRSVRATLTSSQGATKDIWLNRMQEKFPAVFHRITRPCAVQHGAIVEKEDTAQCTKSSLSLEEITFVDNYHLPISGVSSTDTEINLPLLSSLLPGRYPQSIDIGTIQDKDGNHAFRSYTMPIDTANVTTSLFKEYQHYQVPVVHFEGRVGTGNRCIRSDEPFPAKCHKVSSSATVSLASVSRWLKQHIPTVEKGRKIKMSMFNLNRVSVHSLDAVLPSNSSTPTKNSFGTTRLEAAQSHQSFVPSPNSPVFRFLSSLSSHGKNSTVSPQDNCTDLSPIEDKAETLVTSRGSKRHDNFCPFVIPTVIPDTRNINKRHSSMLVDVTPRLVAYFEVTIVKQAQDAPAPSKDNQHGNDQQSHGCVAIGLSTQAFAPQEKLPGWDSKSYGYHGDDGGMFHGEGVSPRYGPCFGPGDVVGCGIEYSTRRIFFTKNGEFLGHKFDKVRKDVMEDGLYPTVGVDTECPIFTNFGEHPFKFDLGRFH